MSLVPAPVDGLMTLWRLRTSGPGEFRPRADAQKRAGVETARQDENVRGDFRQDDRAAEDGCEGLRVSTSAFRRGAKSEGAVEVAEV